MKAHALFGVDYDRIEVVIHPQSVVHSMVEFTDGALIAQLSYPDMRLPIGYALAYPERLREPFGAIDWSRLSQLDFGGSRLRDVRLSWTCVRWLVVPVVPPRRGRTCGEMSCLSRRFCPAESVGLTSRLVVQETLERHEESKLVEVEDVIAADAEARAVASGVIERRIRVA